MSSLAAFRFVALLTASLISTCLGSPLKSTITDLAPDSRARDSLKHAIPQAPHFGIYGDTYYGTNFGPPPAPSIKGFNVFALSFLLLEGAWDKAFEWQSLTAVQRSSIKSQYATAGIKLVVSAFGSTDVPTSMNVDPIVTANWMAEWVKQYNLDGIDVDYEASNKDLNAFDAGDGKAETWLILFTKQLRMQLPQGSYLLTHAPLAPWFSPHIWGGGGYLKVDSAVGNLIDWYNVQFYNQGKSEYTTCSNLLTASSNTWPETSVFQISSNGVPLSKIVIGKPATASDASSGYISTPTLASCLQQAKEKGWNAGVMVWQLLYPPTASPRDIVLDNIRSLNVLACLDEEGS